MTDIAASDIVETVPSALLILDRNLNISSANRAFYQTFRTSPDETEGCHIYDLGNRQWDIPALRTLLESVIPHRASVEGATSQTPDDLLRLAIGLEDSADLIADLAQAFSIEVSTILRSAERRHRNSGKR